MPQFPSWERQLAAWADAARLRRSQLRQVVSDLASRGEEATNATATSVVALAERTRSRCEELPRAMVAELRRRANVLDLATRQDVEAQSRLGRNRVSFVLKEFLEEQRDHEQALLESLRSELQEELQCFAAAIGDDLFASDDQPPPTDREAPRRRLSELDDLVGDEVDLVGDAPGRRAALDATDD